MQIRLSNLHRIIETTEETIKRLQERDAQEYLAEVSSSVRKDNESIIERSRYHNLRDGRVITQEEVSESKKIMDMSEEQLQEWLVFVAETQYSVSTKGEGYIESLVTSAEQDMTGMSLAEQYKAYKLGVGACTLQYEQACYESIKSRSFWDKLLKGNLFDHKSNLDSVSSQVKSVRTRLNNLQFTNPEDLFKEACAEYRRGCAEWIKNPSASEEARATWSMALAMSESEFQAWFVAGQKNEFDKSREFYKNQIKGLAGAQIEAKEMGDDEA